MRRAPVLLAVLAFGCSGGDARHPPASLAIEIAGGGPLLIAALGGTLQLVAVAKDSTKFDNLYRLGVMYLDRDRVNEAARVLYKAHTLRPKNHRVLVNLGADLSLASVMDAKLVRADLTGANLHTTDMRGADLRGANLGRTDLGSVHLLGAVYNARTRWPEGFEPQPRGARMEE